MEALLFFEACRRPLQSITESNFHEMARRFPDNILQMKSSDQLLDMYILPANIPMWPSFYCSKQERADDRNIFFHRVSSTHSLRFHATIDLLRSGEKVVATGVAGIGKSTELNAYMMTFLANIGTDGWPTEVWYRFETTLLKFNMLDNIKCHVEFEESVTLSNLRDRTLKYRNTPILGRPILFLELDEDEVNPRSYVPTLLHPSNRDVYKLTKEFYKSEAMYMLINPPTLNDLCQMAIWEAQFGSSDSVFKGLNRDEIIQLVTERVNLVGPVTRSVFKSKLAFDIFLSYVESAAHEIFEVIGKVTVSNVPSGSKFFVAPFMDDESVVPYVKEGPRGFITLRFLSPYISRLVAFECKKRQQRAILEQRRYDFQIQEDIVQYGLMGRIDGGAHCDSWLLDHWQFYRNSSLRELTSADRLVGGRKEAGITICERKSYFNSVYLDQSVDMLSDHTLYSSLKHNGALFDCMYVDKALKTVFVFQVSDVQANRHSFDTGTVSRVMEGLKLTENGFRMKFFYCCSSRTKSQRSYIISNKKNVASNVESMLDIHIARIKFYPSDAHILI